MLHKVLVRLVATISICEFHVNGPKKNNVAEFQLKIIRTNEELYKQL